MPQSDSNSGNYWEHFNHGADIGVRGYGSTKAGAFIEGAKALISVISDLENIDDPLMVYIHCAAPDDDLLFTDWINALIYEIATRKMLFSNFNVKLTNSQLSAQVFGEYIDVKKHKPAVEIKGATFTELSVTQDADGHWCAQCVVDV